MWNITATGWRTRPTIFNNTDVFVHWCQIFRTRHYRLKADDTHCSFSKLARKSFECHFDISQLKKAGLVDMCVQAFIKLNGQCSHCTLPNIVIRHQVSCWGWIIFRNYLNWIWITSHHSKNNDQRAISKQINKNRNPLKIQILIANILIFELYRITKHLVF